MGVPTGNLTVFGEDEISFLERDEWRELREDTLVGALPTAWAALPTPYETRLIARNNILLVAAAGNVGVDTHHRRDLWYPEHPYWEGNLEWFQQAIDNFATGKVILATYVEHAPGGEIVPYEDVVKCGKAKEFCYSIMHPNLGASARQGDGSGTSAASVQLGSLAFYLFQLWDTPQEVVGVLNTCAEDVGEPGIDEEFGRGVVSVVCDTVRGRERQVVADSMRVFNASPVLTQMAGGHTGSRQLTPQSLSFASRSLPVSEWFKPFYAVRGYTFETVTGHLGGQFSLKGTDLFVSGGADDTPLGIQFLLRHRARVPFMEVGAKRTLLSRNRHTLALLGTYGHTEGADLSARMATWGIHYGQQFPVGTLSLHAVYRQVRGRLGIFGYREAGASPVPFTDGSPEVRFSFSSGW